jgi:hypothetical protein
MSLEFGKLQTLRVFQFIVGKTEPGKILLEQKPCLVWNYFEFCQCSLVLVRLKSLIYKFTRMFRPKQVLYISWLEETGNDSLLFFTLRFTTEWEQQCTLILIPTHKLVNWHFWMTGVQYISEDKHCLSILAPLFQKVKNFHFHAVNKVINSRLAGVKQNTFCEVL